MSQDFSMILILKIFCYTTHSHTCVGEFVRVGGEGGEEEEEEGCIRKKDIDMFGSEFLNDFTFEAAEDKGV